MLTWFLWVKPDVMHGTQTHTCFSGRGCTCMQVSRRTEGQWHSEETERQHDDVSSISRIGRPTCQHWQEISDSQVAQVQVGHVFPHEAELEDHDHDQQIPNGTHDEDDGINKSQDDHPFQRQGTLWTEDFADVSTGVIHDFVLESVVRRSSPAPEWWSAGSWLLSLSHRMQKLATWATWESLLIAFSWRNVLWCAPSLPAQSSSGSVFLFFQLFFLLQSHNNEGTQDAIARRSRIRKKGELETIRSGRGTSRVKRPKMKIFLVWYTSWKRKGTWNYFYVVWEVERTWASNEVGKKKRSCAATRTAWY